MVHLFGNNIELRPAIRRDAKARLALGNDPDIMRMFGVSHIDVRSFLKNDADLWLHDIARHQHAWVIEIEHRFVGEIRLDNFNLADRHASMAIGIFDRDMLGKGLGSKAIRLVLMHAFTDLHLHRIGIRVLEFNTRAVRAYEKCGFVIEGRERETAFVDGRWHDDIIMGLLAREFNGQHT
ncbi:GNAT family N-acetyltransferase [Rhizobium sp. 9140]|uniref:GNAT family N-acetyltransferase n=1 Tax=Rhizobium sp. 9140 TaxID=1761900 RepID=UPI000796A310|nr:GNAT family protein [Rhizobium sp. 9140]CZT34329.1 Protein N-acetyltransferase, RimJ/RimL family [Rhizobium sp. 9140]